MTRIASIQSVNTMSKRPVVLYGHAKKIFLSDRTQIRFSQRTLVQFCKQFTELFISGKIQQGLQCLLGQCTGEGLRRSQVPYSVWRELIPWNNLLVFVTLGMPNTEGALLVLEINNFPTISKPEFTFSVSSKTWVAWSKLPMKQTKKKVLIRIQILIFCSASDQQNL